VSLVSDHVSEKLQGVLGACGAGGKAYEFAVFGEECPA
jgi:hypothetical protein